MTFQEARDHSLGNVRYMDVMEPKGKDARFPNDGTIFSIKMMMFLQTAPTTRYNVRHFATRTHHDHRHKTLKPYPHDAAIPRDQS
jgi:hypothetical protein